MCPLVVPDFQGFFLRWPLTVLMKQTRQAVRTFKQSILLRCLWSFVAHKIAVNFVGVNAALEFIQICVSFIFFLKTGKRVDGVKVHLRARFDR
jgi:hypothetical protein